MTVPTRAGASPRDHAVGDQEIRVHGLDVVTAGEAMVLLLADPGVPIDAATTFRRSVAGAESNVAIALARLGHRVGWFGRIGRDPFGDVVLRTLRGEGIDVSHVRRDPAPTGLLVRDCLAERPVEVLYFRTGSAGSRLTLDDVDPDYIRSARVLYLSGVTAQLGEAAARATERAVEIAREAEVLVCFDPNVRGRLMRPESAGPLLAALASRADLVLAGADEIDLLSGGAGASWLLERGVRLVVTKRGVDGVEATDGSERWSKAAVPVRLVDAVGAGDAFAAGFLSGWLRGAGVEVSLDEGVALAASCLQVATDIDGLPSVDRDGAVALPGAEVRR